MRVTKIHISVFIFAVIICLCPGPAAAQEAVALNKKMPDHTHAARSDSNPVLKAIQFFGNTISRADGDRCPMAPTCSAYSAQAIKKHGLLKGWIMTSDRLMRCGRDELKHSDTILIEGKRRSYDPLRNNDFWWQSK
jgi:putative component of membrane protein insertase Oxa1/YidC/SpoIIIJ protein YidD